MIPEAGALATWRKKLGFLLAEEAQASNAEQKFELQEQIAEARAKLRELQLEIPLADPQNTPGPRLHNLPFPSLDGLFKGRGALLAQLSGDLETTALVQSQLLSGLGGIGKTRLAVEYAWRTSARYTACFFVRADSPQSLHSAVAGLAGPRVLDLGLGAIPEDDAMEVVLRWLREHPGWLLILDNVDTRAAAIAAKKLLPILSDGHVLLTSRLVRWPREIQKRGLDKLESDDAVRYLIEATDGERHHQDDERFHARDLAELLDGLPLALEQAASYIRVHGLAFEQYLTAWRDRRPAVLQWYDDDEMSYPCSMAVTWEHSFAQVKAPSRALLRLFAHLATEPIPVEMPRSQDEIVTEAVELLIEETDEDAGTMDVERALADLARYSLVTRDGDAVAVHRMVQEVVRKRIPKDGRRAWIEKAVRMVNEFAPRSPDDVRTWPVWDRLRPHAARVVELGDKAGVESPTTDLMNQLATLLWAKSLHDQAEPLMRRALEIDESAFGGEHPNVARHLNNLAQLLQATHRLLEAEPLMRRALEIDESAFGGEHPNVARDLNNLAALLQDTHRLLEAEPLMRRALEIFESSLGDEHPSTMTVQKNLELLLQALDAPTEPHNPNGVS